MSQNKVKGNTPYLATVWETKLALYSLLSKMNQAKVHVLFYTKERTEL